MDKLKPEDVMKAFDWQVSVANRIGSVTMSKEDINAISALLREKDAEIKGLVDGWSKDQDRFEKVCAEKDAEIERLSHHCDDCAGCTQWKCDCSNIRAEAIDEFAERLKAKAEPMPMYSHLKIVYTSDIDQIAKELKGEGNDSVSESKD